MKNNKYSLKNFRVFGDEGAEFEIAPITVVTGGNSSGKSSVIKSLMLLNESMKDVFHKYNNNSEFDLLNIKLKFHEGKHNLGSFEKTISSTEKTISSTSESKEMSFTYSFFSNLIGEEVSVSMVFKLDKNDFLRTAILRNIEIVTGKEQIFKFDINSEDRRVLIFCNALYLKHPFINFMKGKYRYDDLMHYLNKDAMGPDEFLRFKKIEDVYSTIPESKLHFFKQVVKVEENLLAKDIAKQLFLKEKDFKYDELPIIFYLPFNKYFGNSNKDNLLDDFHKLIEEELSSTEFNSESINNSIKIINYFFETFIKSDNDCLLDFYQEIENRFLSVNFKEIDISENIDLILNQIKTNQKTHNYIISFQSDNSKCDVESNNIIDTFNNLISPDDVETILNSEELDFEIIFKAFLDIFIRIDNEFYKNRVFAPNQGNIFTIGYYFEYYKPVEYELFVVFMSAVIQEALIQLPSFLNNTTFVDAVRANIQRVYTFRSQGTDFNNLMVSYMNYLNSPQKDNNKTSYVLGVFMREWLKKFEIADEVIFERTPDDLGVLIYIVRNGTKTLLADEGFGITQILSILFQIELNAIKAPFSYQYPFLANSVTKFNESCISIEEPEINLHPKFQSMLADMFIDAYKRFNIKFIIETHSEYFIRKLQTFVAKKNISANDVAVHYIHHPNVTKRPKGVTHVEKINILQDGRLDRGFGAGFFDEADNLAIDLFTIQQNRKN